MMGSKKKKLSAVEAELHTADLLPLPLVVGRPLASLADVHQPFTESPEAAKLRLFLEAFGMSERTGTKEIRNRRHSVEVHHAMPEGANYDALHEEEVQAAASIVQELLAAVAPLQRMGFRRDAERERRLNEIVSRWNNSICEATWKTLPPLCTVCRAPVLLRGLSADGSPKTTCTEECKTKAKDARKHVRNKQRTT